MKHSKWCDFDDCPNHPDYVEVVKEEKVEEKEKILPDAIYETVLQDFSFDQGHNHNVYTSAGTTGNAGWSNVATTGIAANSINWGSSNIRIAPLETGIVLETDSISIPLECFTCELMEKKNMKKTLIINKAKKILEE